MGVKRTVVRYRTKPERATENARLIEKVFQELQANASDGVRYLALQLSDGTFVHFVMVETEDGSSPLARVEAFQERYVEPPQASEAIIVGSYRMLGE
jgi:hypothetical protein